MRLLRLAVFAWIGLALFVVVSFGSEFRLINGDIIRGEAVSFNDDGMVVRLDIGGYSPQIGWSKLTQETLQELAQNPKAANFVEPFIDTPPPKAKEKSKKDIVLKLVPRIDRVPNPNFLASIATPAGLVIFLVLFLANLYAAYAVALFRQRPPALVCGVSALLPFVGPALFLSLPPGEHVAVEAAPPPEAAGGPVADKSSTGSLAKVPGMASGLSIASQQEKAAAATEGPQTYKRGEFTFNRRFFETKFPSFFRIMPNEADMVMAVRTPKTEHVAKRITRISSTEVHLQLTNNKEVSVTFPEITEIVLRKNDSKG